MPSGCGGSDALRGYADEMSDAFAEQLPAVHEVMGAIINRLAPRPPSLNAVAGTLGMSARSLQRILKAEAHAYRELVETVR